MRPRVVVHIDELVLHGVAPADRAAVGAALQQELGRLLGERGVPAGLAASGAVPRIDAGTAPHASGTGSLGTSVAQAVYRGIGG